MIFASISIKKVSYTYYLIDRSQIESIPNVRQSLLIFKSIIWQEKTNGHVNSNRFLTSVIYNIDYNTKKKTIFVYQFFFLANVTALDIDLLFTFAQIDFNEKNIIRM